MNEPAAVEAGPDGPAAVGSEVAGLVRSRVGGVAPEPRGDAPARRRPAGPAAPDRASLGRRGRQRPLRLPGRPMAALERHAAELPRRSSTGRRPRRAPRSAGSTRCIGRSSGRGTQRATRQLSLWVHATLVESTMAVSDAWLEPLGTPAARGLLRRDPADRPRVRRARCDAPGRPGSLRIVLGRDAGTGPVPCRWDRSPASWRASSCDRRSPAPSRGCRSRRALYDWTLWPSVGLLPARSGRHTACRGPRATDWSRNGSSPGGAPGARSCHPGSARCRKRWRRTAGSPRDLASHGWTQSRSVRKLLRIRQARVDVDAPRRVRLSIASALALTTLVVFSSSNSAGCLLVSPCSLHLSCCCSPIALWHNLVGRFIDTGDPVRLNPGSAWRSVHRLCGRSCCDARAPAALMRSCRMGHDRARDDEA